MTRNNTLDTAEFAIAMHLIQSRLKGTDIPEKLPETLNPVYLPTVDIPAISPEEKEVYEKAFMWNVNSKTGFIDGKHQKDTLLDQHLSHDVGSKVKVFEV